MIIRNKSKINLILFCLLFIVLLGCGKPFYKAQSESDIKKEENEERRKYFEEKLAERAMELKKEIEKAEKELSEYRKVIEHKTSLENKIKETEEQMKVIKDKLDEIIGQINIYTAKQRRFIQKK